MNKPIATIKRTNEILKKYDLFAKKKYGQNFIIEPKIVENIASVAIDKEDSLVIEVGPGIGALTEQLAKKAKKVIAFEIDERLKEVLEDTLSEYPNVEVIIADFLNIDLEKFLNEVRKDYETIYFVSNLPYYITTPILFKLFECNEQFDAITCMMQKEVALRFSAKVNSSDYNALSIMAQYLYNLKIVLNIPKTIFNPKPNVDSAVIRFVPKKDTKINQGLFDFIKICFKQRRKTLYNNMRAVYASDLVNEVLDKCQIDVNVRAQELEIDDFIKIYEVLNER